jgi:hypothetical protein
MCICTFKFTLNHNDVSCQKPTFCFFSPLLRCIILVRYNSHLLIICLPIFDRIPVFSCVDIFIHNKKSHLTSGFHRCYDKIDNWNTGDIDNANTSRFLRNILFQWRYNFTSLPSVCLSGRVKSHWIKLFNWNFTCMYSSVCILLSNQVSLHLANYTKLCPLLIARMKLFWLLSLQVEHIQLKFKICLWYSVVTGQVWVSLRLIYFWLVA